MCERTNPIESAFAKGFGYLAKVIAGVRFVDGVENSEDQIGRAAA
jgi:hypothetical protein